MENYILTAKDIYDARFSIKKLMPIYTMNSFAVNNEPVNDLGGHLFFLKDKYASNISKMNMDLFNGYIIVDFFQETSLDQKLNIFNEIKNIFITFLYEICKIVNTGLEALVKLINAEKNNSFNFNSLLFDSAYATDSLIISI